MALTGCGAWNRYVKPEIQTPESWSAPRAEASAAWPDAEWWKQFNATQLTALIEEAQRSNHDLAAAVARVRQADAEARIAGAALLPSVGATGGAARNRQNRSSANTYNVRLNASYEIDFWGKNSAASDAAKAIAEASRFDQETVRLTILSAVANTYVDILATRERLAIAKQGVANAERLLESIQKRFKQGIVSGLEVAQQETVTANQRAAIPNLELRLKQSENALALLLGRLPTASQAPDGKLSEIAIPVIAPGLPSELLLRRPDVQLAEAQLRAANANITVARAAFFPNIALTAAGGYQSAALSSLFNPSSALFTLVASVAQSIFEGGRLTGELERSKARYDELLHNYQQSALAAFADVEDALAAAQQSAVAEDARRKAAESARKAFELAERRLEGGIVDITSVLDTQRSLFSAEDAFAEAKLAHVQALIGLYKALGGGWKISADNASAH